MRTSGISLFLLMLGIASVNAQTASGSGPAAIANAAPSTLSEKEPGLEANSPKIGSTAGASELEHSRLATRPPTPLVSK